MFLDIVKTNATKSLTSEVKSDSSEDKKNVSSQVAQRILDEGTPFNCPINEQHNAQSLLFRKLSLRYPGRKINLSDIKVSGAREFPKGISLSLTYKKRVYHLNKTLDSNFSCSEVQIARYPEVLLICIANIFSERLKTPITPLDLKIIKCIKISPPLPVGARCKNWCYQFKVKCKGKKKNFYLHENGGKYKLEKKYKILDSNINNGVIYV